MKKRFTFIFSILTFFGITQTIQINPSASGIEPYDFGTVLVGSYLDQDFTITTNSNTPINLSYIWGNAGYSGTTSCNYVSRFSVVSFPSQIDNQNPGTITLRFYPQSYNTYTKFNGNCIKTGSNNGAVNVVGDLQISENNVYSSTMNLRGTGALTTGLNEINKLKTSIYPNPTNTMLYITNSTANRFEILDTKGLMVAQGEFSGQYIDVYSLSSGMYFLKLISIEGDIDSHRFIKL